MRISLFDYLVLNTSADYISDLRFLLGECVLVLRNIDDPDEFSLDDWNRVGTYLTGTHISEHSGGLARSEILYSLGLKLR